MNIIGYKDEVQVFFKPQENFVSMKPLYEISLGDLIKSKGENVSISSRMALSDYG